MITSLFSAHRRVAIFKWTRVYVISLPLPRWLESVPSLALYRISETKNSKSGYTRTLTILVPENDMSKYWDGFWDGCWRV